MRVKKEFNLLRDGVWIASGTFDELVDELGVSKSWLHTIRTRKKDIRSKIFTKIEGEKVGIYSVYAYYIGDEFVTSGTAKELEKITGMNAGTLVSYASQVRKNKRKFIYHNYTLEEI